jgi:anti-anti-sigma regulatory factor
MSNTAPNPACLLALPESLLLQRLPQLKEALSKLLEQDGPVMIEANRSSRLSFGAVQLLTSFIITLEKAGRKVVVSRPSAILLSGFAGSGLLHIIKDRIIP